MKDRNDDFLRLMEKMVEAIIRDQLSDDDKKKCPEDEEVKNDEEAAGELVDAMLNMEDLDDLLDDAAEANEVIKDAIGKVFEYLRDKTEYPKPEEVKDKEPKCEKPCDKQCYPKSFDELKAKYNNGAPHLGSFVDGLIKGCCVNRVGMDTIKLQGLQLLLIKLILQEDDRQKALLEYLTVGLVSFMRSHGYPAEDIAKLESLK